MKKILSILLPCFLILSLCGCDKAIIYEEEKTVNQWISQNTKGYTQITPSRMMYLKKDKEGFTVRIDTGSDLSPRITVISDKDNATALDNTILTVTQGETAFAASSHANTFYDPYRNAYTETMKVYQKDENTFRIFFWLYGENTDFYPVPVLLTAEQYQQMLPIVEAYTEEKRLESEDAGESPVNYLGDFMAAYEGKYFSDRATNPDGTIFYEYKGGSEYLSVYRNLFSQLGLSEQNWRKSYEKLGYTGPKENLQIVYCDVSVTENTVSLCLNASEAYTSPALKATDPHFTYAFCPTLADFDFIDVKVQ